jgi:glutathione S-transferase
MPEIQLYSAAVCPFAQRSRIVLYEKGIDFSVHEIDLKNKPTDFETISPHGKVPVLIHGASRIWESTIINEYLEEVFPQPPLMPEPPALRALVRIWVDFVNTRFIPAFYKLLLAQEAQEQSNWREELGQHLLFMEHQGLGVLAGEGPYWLGAQFSLLDIALYPWFERWAAIAHYRGATLPAACSRLIAWEQQVRDHPAIQVTAQSGDYHIAQYSQYASGAATGKTAQEMRRY